MKRQITVNNPIAKSIIYKQSEIVSITVARFEQFKLAECYVCSLAITGFACAAIAADLEYISDTSTNSLILSCLSTITTIILIFAIYWRIKQELQWEQAKGIYSYLDNIYNTGKIYNFLLESILNIIHPIIGIGSASFTTYSTTFDSPITYQYSSILTVFMIIRCYHILRLISIFSSFRSSRSQRLCQMNGTYAGTIYAVKAMMREFPFAVMGLMLLAGIFVFGFSLRQFERPASILSGKDFSDYGNAMWCIITTMTTVGYGDYYPVTFPGRLIGALACFWGVLVISFMCVSLYNFLVLDTGEATSLLILHRLWFKDEMKEKAALLISSVYRYRYMMKYQNLNKLQMEIQLGKVRKNLSDFETCKNKQRTLYNFGSYSEIIQYKLDDILDSDNIDNLNIDIDNFIEKLEMKIKKMDKESINGV